MRILPSGVRSRCSAREQHAKVGWTLIVRRNNRVSHARSNPAANGSVVIAMNSRNCASIKPAPQHQCSRINDPAME
jgi:hypothetical protein